MWHATYKAIFELLHCQSKSFERRATRNYTYTSKTKYVYKCISKHIYILTFVYLPQRLPCCIVFSIYTTTQSCILATMRSPIYQPIYYIYIYLLIYVVVVFPLAFPQRHPSIDRECLPSTIHLSAGI